jgi:hypothetical protein
MRIKMEVKTMARPKSTAPKKVHLNLTVTEQTRAELAYLAAANQQSISELLAAWASKEAKKLAKKQGKPLPTPEPEQLSIS